MQKFYRLLFLFVLIFAVSCDEIDDGSGNVIEDGGPTIVSFAPSLSEVDLGESATLSWSVNDATSITIDNGIGDVTNDEDSQVTVTPTQTTTYILSATNDQGQSRAQTRITVSGTPTTPPPPGEDAAAPTGSLGVSDTQGGPFQNDESSNITSPDDDRIVTVEPGDTFYAQVDYEDPSGIADINISLVNSNPPGISGELNPSDPELGYFTKGDPIGTCDLSGSAMNVTCVYPITVSEDAVNITALENPANEFAYVFRTLVTDGAGNTSEELIRGYVIVDADGDTPPTNPNPPTPPTPPSNQAPNADAGDDQEVDVGEEVRLNGSGSSDPDGDTLSYSWEFTSQPEGSSATLADTASPTFTPSQAGDYVAQLTVTDGNGGSDTDSVTITAESDEQPPGNPDPPANQDPTADAGDDQEVDVGEEVTLNGSGSSDPDDDNLSYAWEFTSQPDGSDASLNNANTATPTFTPSEVGSYTVQLTVSDGNGGSDTDSVTVTAQIDDEPPTNPTPPEENEDPDVSIEEVDDLTLEGGSASTSLAASVDDDEDDSFSYQWSVTSGEADNVEFDSPTSEDTDVTFSAADDYTLQLTVTDTNDSDSTGSATVAVTVHEASTDPPPTNPNPPANEAPTAAFTSQQQEGTLSVQFNASSSNDPDGTIASYNWDFGDGSSGDTQVFTRTYSSPGSYDVTLTVTDNDGATDTETKNVTVEEAEIAEAPDIITFTADPNPATPDEEVTLSWDLAGGEATTLTTLDLSNGLDRDVTGENSTVVEVPTSRTFRLTATNEAGTDTAEVTLNVSGAIIVPGDDLVAEDDDIILDLSEEPVPEIDIDIIANDNYPEGNFPDIEISSEPTNGTAFLDSDMVIYEPEEGFTGTDTFEYTLTLGEDGPSDSATVTVTVQE